MLGEGGMDLACTRIGCIVFTLLYSVGKKKCLASYLAGDGGKPPSIGQAEYSCSLSTTVTLGIDFIVDFLGVTREIIDRA